MKYSEFRDARRALLADGIAIVKVDHEYRVNFTHGHPDTAYYTDDPQDAVDTGRDMVRRAIDPGGDPDDLSTREGTQYDATTLVEPGWRASDGEHEDYYPDAATGRQAAEEYVEAGDWGDLDRTIWVEVRAWRRGIGLDEDGDICEYLIGECHHTITLDPQEPPCVDDEGHDWQSPIEIVGGIRENPGVWGHGGGVVINEVCVRCGCGKQTDTWAQNPENGVQGLVSVSYEPGRYADELADFTFSHED